MIGIVAEDIVGNHIAAGTPYNDAIRIIVAGVI